MTDNESQRGRRLVWTLLPTAVMLLAIWPFASIAAGNDKEAQVKAAYMLNFAKLIEWPVSAFVGHPGTFGICVPSASPLAELIQAQQGKSVKGRSVVWKVFEGFDTVNDCQVIFIPELRRLSQAIKAVGSRPVLIVGEQDGFCQAGGGINLVSSDDRITFEVNLKALQRVGLKAGAQLLKVAREVIQ